MNKENSKYPDLWEEKPLGEVCKIIMGQSPKGTSYNNEGIGTPLINGPVEFGKKPFSKTKKTKFTTEPTKYCIENDLILCVRGSTTGRINIAGFNACIGRGVAAIRYPENQFWVNYFILHSRENIYNLGTGATFPNVSSQILKSLNIPLPPLPQQKQIVTILDKAFAAIDTAKANAAQNLQNAKELFESYLQNVFENKGDDWEEKTLKEVTSKIGSGATPRGGRASYKEEGISLIRSMNVHDFYFKEKNLAFIDEQQASALSNVTLEEEDVLLNITGASIARCCIVPKEYLPARVNQHVSIIRAKKEIINSLFLASLLTSKFFKDKILAIGEQGATRQAITKAQLENFPISFPKTIKEQEDVIQKINLLKTETQKLEAIYTQKLADLEEMKKSILQKAFSGQLTHKS